MFTTKTVNGAETLEGAPASFIERLADKLGITARASAIYGSPVERDGVTVIPVASVRYGFGGGGGEGMGDNGEHGEGSGGGGGVTAKPIGYIEMKNGETTFRPIQDRSSIALLIVAGGVAGMLTLRGIARLTRPLPSPLPSSPEAR